MVVFSYQDEKSLAPVIPGLSEKKQLLHYTGSDSVQARRKTGSRLRDLNNIISNQRTL